MNKHEPYPVVDYAWYWRSEEYGNDIDIRNRLIFGKTRSKAKYEFYLKLREQELVENFKEFITTFTFWRAPMEDWLQLPHAPILDMLTTSQRDILLHACGLMNLGYRNYYFTFTNCPDCKTLIDIGLFKKGEVTNNYCYYWVTELGEQVVRTTEPTRRKHIGKINEQK